MASPRGKFGVIFLTVFIDLLGFGMVIPILPLYAERLHASDLQTGFLLSIYSVMQLFFAPVWGRLSDRTGRRPVLLLSIFGSCGSQLGYAFAPNLFWLFVARAFAGLCGANISAAQAYIADCTDAKARAGGMGLLGAALGLGFVFGPAIGGLLSHRSPTLPFLTAGTLAAINFVLAFFIITEPRPPGKRTAARTITWEGLLRAIGTPRLLALLLLYFFVTFGFANLEGTFSLFLERRFSYGRREASYLFVFIGVLIAVVQGVLVRRLAPRFGERRLVILGTMLMGIGFFLQYRALSLTPLLVAVAITAVGNGLHTPSLSALISRAVEGEQQGGVLGVAQSLGALARILGPVAGTYLLRFTPATPYLFGGVVMMAASLFANAAVRQPRGDAQHGYRRSRSVSNTNRE